MVRNLIEMVRNLLWNPNALQRPSASSHVNFFIGQGSVLPISSGRQLSSAKSNLLRQPDDTPIAKIVFRQARMALVRGLPIKGGITGQDIDCPVTAAEGASAIAAFCIRYIVNYFIFIGIIRNKQAQHIGLLQYRISFGFPDSAHIEDFRHHAAQCIAPAEQGSCAAIAKVLPFILRRQLCY